MKTMNVKTLSALVLALIMSSSLAHAESRWQKKHPRRAEVNKRLKNQQKRVDSGLANGSMTTQQAQKVQNQDAHIRNQERNDAAANGGHITQGEQNKINHEENGVSNEIKRDDAGH